MANVADGATGTILTAPSPATSGTSVTLNAGEGYRFPAVPFFAIVHANNSIPTVSTSEKVQVTAQGQTTIASGSNGASLPQATINVVDATSLNSSGSVTIVTSAGAQVVTYTGKTGTTLTGASGGTGTMSTGGAVMGDNFTIVRAQTPYSAQSIAVTWRFSNAIFSTDLNNASMVRNEVPVGSVNGSNTAFTTASQFQTKSLMVYLNGQRLVSGVGNDYVETAGGFTMQYAPATGDVLLVDYFIGGTINNIGTNSIISDEAVTGSVNGSNTSFTTQRPYISTSLEVYVNGLHQIRGADYTETSSTAGTFTMTTAPLTGDIVRVNYQYNLNPASNADTIDGFHAFDVVGQSNVVEAETGGWKKLPANAGLAYVSYSSTTKMGVISTSIDLTGFVSKGNRIWIDQSGTKYGIIQELTSTNLYVFFGQNYTLANAAINSPYISREYAPQGFIPTADIWSLFIKDTVDRLQSATASTWYLPTGSTLQLTSGHGRWRNWYEASPRCHGTSATWLEQWVTLSTTTNSETDSDMTDYGGEDVASGGVITLTNPFVCEKVVDNGTTATTTYSLLHKVNCSSGSMGTTNGFKSPSKIRITSAYI